MAIMTLPIAIPSTPSVENNSPDTDTTKKQDNSSSNNNTTPPTPVSPTMPSPLTTNTTASANTQQQPQSPAGQAKRKPSRRANTAERRATHNAVERQRRETLNGRFLDLAALLPNLSQIRRPSKSSIVNSSIAHIHASRRHRLLASRELRMLKIEADALRRELNEWRERAGIPRIDEPVRGDGFAMIISGELEVIVGVPNGGAGDDDEDDDGMDVSGSYGGYVGGDGVIREEEFALDMHHGHGHGPEPVSPTSPVEESAMMAAMIKNHGHPFAHGVQGGAGLPLQRPVSMGSGATNVPATFDPMYDAYPAHVAHPQHPHHLGQQQQHQQQHHAQMQHQQMMQQHAYMQQQALRERERERESASLREREQRAMYQRQQEQEKMWGLYNSSAPANNGNPNGGAGNGKLAYPYPSQNQQQNQQMMMMQAAQRSLFTPPATSHGLPTPSNGGSSPMAGPGSPASLSSVSDEHHHYVQQQQHRERSGSVHSSHSGRGSHSPAYELGAPDYGNGEFGGVPRGMGMNIPNGGMDMMSMGVPMGLSVGVEGM